MSDRIVVMTPPAGPGAGCMRDRRRASTARGSATTRDSWASGRRSWSTSISPAPSRDVEIHAMSGRSRLWLALAGVAVIAAVVGVVMLSPRRGGDVTPKDAAESLPQPGSPDYAEMVGAFYGGVTALDVDANDNARDFLGLATKLVPEEPAAWADLGLLEIRANNFPAAEADLARARGLAPESGHARSRATTVRAARRASAGPLRQRRSPASSRAIAARPRRPPGSRLALGRGAPSGEGRPRGRSRDGRRAAQARCRRDPQETARPTWPP